MVSIALNALKRYISLLYINIL